MDKERVLVAGVIAISVALAGSDFIGSVAAFWTGHAMASAVLSGIVLVFLTALVLERLIDAREGRRWREPGLFANNDVAVAGMSFLYSLRNETWPWDYNRDPGEDPIGMDKEDFMPTDHPDAFRTGVESLREHQARLLALVERWTPVLVSNEILQSSLNAALRLERATDQLVNTLQGMGNPAAGEYGTATDDELADIALSHYEEIRSACEDLDDESEKLGGRREAEDRYELWATEDVFA